MSLARFHAMRRPALYGTPARSEPNPPGPHRGGRRGGRQGGLWAGGIDIGERGGEGRSLPRRPPGSMRSGPSPCHCIPPRTRIVVWATAGLGSPRTRSKRDSDQVAVTRIKRSLDQVAVTWTKCDSDQVAVSRIERDPDQVAVSRI